MGVAKKAALLLTVRIGAELTSALAREARRRGTTKSEVAREILSASLVRGRKPNLAAEARWQSLLVSRRRSEKETLEFLESAAETSGWC